MVHGGLELSPDQQVLRDLKAMAAALNRQFGATFDGATIQLSPRTTEAAEEVRLVAACGLELVFSWRENERMGGVITLNGHSLIEHRGSLSGSPLLPVSTHDLAQVLTHCFGDAFGGAVFAVKSRVYHQAEAIAITSLDGQTLEIGVYPHETAFPSELMVNDESLPRLAFP